MKNPFKPLCFPCLIGAGVVVAIAIAGIFAIVRSDRRNETPAPLPSEAERTAMVQYGQELLTARLNAGEDISAGPCLDNGERFPGWVIDVAHSPRQAVDNLPENQCSAYHEGRAKNFIELDTSGNLIRIYP